MIPAVAAELGKLLSGSNQFASGGLLLMAVGAVGASLRNVPHKLWDLIRNQTTISVTIVDEVEAHRWFKWWVGNIPYGKSSRRVDAYTVWDGSKYVNRVSLAPGFHWFFHKKRPMFINITRDEKKDQYNSRRSETVRIWTYGRNQKYFVDLLSEMREMYFEEKDKSARLFYRDIRSEWNESHGFKPRPLDSVILPDSIKKVVLDDLKHFGESSKWYEEMGIPYHRGYLLHGPPGTGKTSLILGLAHELKSRVYVINLAEMDDSSLLSAVTDAAAGSMVILEDVDCVVPTRDRSASEESGPLARRSVTLSGLLNVLDGVSTPYGIRFFLTTNYVDKLDPALIRPGRIDMNIHVPVARDEEVKQLYTRFFPSDEAEVRDRFLSGLEATTMAEFQREFMEERNRRISRQARSLEPQLAV